ncbi:MAG: tyrosine--tRNA ligase [Candidatus Woesearchaeota archaeon]
MDKFELVKRNTEEILTEDELKELLKKDKIGAYYGIAPTGQFHMGYLVPLSKVFDFSNAGIKTKILVADIHAALDDLKTPWEELEKRAAYYKKCIELAFPWKEVPEFVTGSSFQMNKDYQTDVLKIATMSTVSRATRAASEVTRMKNPKVSELIYPIMQALDEQYLDVDIQLGGVDQRHIMVFAREYLPKVGYKPRVEIMTPLVVGLKGPGAKMSASEPMSHIKVYDSEDMIKKKISNAYCEAGVVEDNPMLQLCKYILFPVQGKLEIKRPEKFGGNLDFNSYEELEKAFSENKLHPMDLKNALSASLIDIFSRAREFFCSEEGKKMLQELGEGYI